MELRNLVSFLRVAELGNFTKAANQLGYSQAAVTVHIKQLEEEFGISLFERQGNNNILTPFGQQLMEYANQILEVQENIHNLANSDPLSLQGILRLGAIESVAASVLVPIMEKFYSLHPKVQIDIRTGYNKSLFELLYRNECDIIFTIGNETAPQHCRLLASSQETVSFFASVHHPLASRADLQIADIFDYPLILTGQDSFLERELFRLSDSFGKKIHFSVRSNSTNTIIGLVEQGVGISFLGNSNLRQSLENKSIVILPVTDYSFSYSINAYRNRTKWITPPMTGFIDLLLRNWNPV